MISFFIYFNFSLRQLRTRGPQSTAAMRRTLHRSQRIRKISKSSGLERTSHQLEQIASPSMHMGHLLYNRWSSSQSAFQISFSLNSRISRMRMPCKQPELSSEPHQRKLRCSLESCCSWPSSRYLVFETIGKRVPEFPPLLIQCQQRGFSS